MDCGIVRESLSARIDGEREPIPAARVDEHLAGCGACRDWQISAVEQTQVLRKMAGRSQLAVVRQPTAGVSPSVGRRTVSWSRWALACVGLVQLGLALAQGLGANLGVPHADSAGHVLNESTAWSAALGVVMLAAALRPVTAAGLMWVLTTFAGFLFLYEVVDADDGRVTFGRPLTHLPVVVGAALAFLVWRRDRAGGGDHSDRTAMVGSEYVGRPENTSRARRRSDLSAADGSAA